MPVRLALVPGQEMKSGVYGMLLRGCISSGDPQPQTITGGFHLDYRVRLCDQSGGWEKDPVGTSALSFPAAKTQCTVSAAVQSADRASLGEDKDPGAPGRAFLGPLPACACAETVPQMFKL